MLGTVSPYGDVPATIASSFDRDTPVRQPEPETTRNTHLSTSDTVESDNGSSCNVSRPECFNPRPVVHTAAVLFVFSFWQEIYGYANHRPERLYE